MIRRYCVQISRTELSKKIKLPVVYFSEVCLVKMGVVLSFFSQGKMEG